MSDTPQSPGHIIGLVLIALIACLVVLDGLMTGLYRVPDQFVSNWNGQAGLITGRYPFIDSWAELPKDGGASLLRRQYREREALPVPRALQAIDIAMWSLIRSPRWPDGRADRDRLLAQKSVTGWPDGASPRSAS